MRFVTAERNGRTFLGIVNQDMKTVVDLHKAEARICETATIPSTMTDFILEGETFISKVKEILEGVEENPTSDIVLNITDVKLLAPIPRPAKNIFCVGKNYADHAIELGSVNDIPEHVMMFTKAPTTVIGPDAIIQNHKQLTEQLDYEGELAVIIGKKGRSIREEDALNYVFGYTILNDITARDIQTRHKQFFLGKSLDTTCPMGPFIAHTSVIPNPGQLHIQTKVNGEIRQDGNTEQFIFPIEKILAVISSGMTLEPGDIIATGTPAGVGKGFKPPRFLKPGDMVEVSIEGLGTLRNKIEK